MSKQQQMNELCDAENLSIEVSNNELRKKKRKLFSSKQLYEQIRKKRGVGGKMRWRTKSGLDGTFIKLMACQQDTDEYFCRIKMATWV